MLCIICGKTFTHELTCTNCGFNYSKSATLASLFELDVTTINVTIANQTQSLEHKTLLDDKHPERIDVAHRQRMRHLQPAPKTVSKMPYSIYYDGKKYNGLYSGQIKKCVANGAGTFQHEDKEKYFTYTGSWENGELKGQGVLCSNDIIVHFPEVNRKGTYSGGVVDGIFCGQGKFSATSGDGFNYTYEGEWKNGLWDGQGKQVFDADFHTSFVGTFIKSYFIPTVLEFFTSVGTSKNTPYSITKKTQNFIVDHEELFLMNSGESISEYIDKRFTYAAFSENPSSYGDKLFKVTNLRVVYVFESDDYCGRRATLFLAYDKRRNFYKGTLLNKSEKIVKDKSVTLYALPLDYSTYKDVNGNFHKALIFAAVYVK